MEFPDAGSPEPLKTAVDFPQAGLSHFLRLGLDIGSTTIKAVLVDNEDNILFSRYERHLSHIQGSLAKILAEIAAEFPGGAALGT